MAPSGDRDGTARWPARVGLGAAGLCALLPFVAAFVAWRDGWMPTSDWASVVIRSWDTFSSDPPLIGIYSSATTSSGGTTIVYHPGPLQEWLLAAPIHLFAPSTAGILMGSALLVSLSLVTVFATAWRRCGWAGLQTAVVAMALFMAGTGPTMLREPLHTWLATYAMVAFVACAWAVLDGGRWWWPAAVFFASVAGQAQVAYLVPGAFVVIMLIGSEIRTTTGRRSSPRTGPADRIGHGQIGHGRIRHGRAPVLTAIVVGVACWAAPLWDQFFGSGNLGALLTTGGDGSAVGPGWALRDLAKTLSIPPSWTAQDLHLSVHVLGGGRMTWHTSAWEWSTAAVVIVVLGAGFRRAIRRRATTRVALGTVAITSLVGCFVAASIMPDEPFSLLGHREIWRFAGVVTWVFVVWCAVERVGTLPTGRRTLPAAGTRVVASAVAVIVVVAVFVSVTARSSPASSVGSIGLGSVEMFTAVATPFCQKGAVLLEPTTLVDAPTTLGVIAMLTIRGCDVHARGLDDILPGRLHRATGKEPTRFTIDGFDNPPPGCRRIAAYDPAHPPERYRGFSHALGRLQRDGPLYLFACEATS